MNGVFKVEQNDFIEKILVPPTLAGYNDVTLLNDQLIKDFRHMIGQLQWVAGQTRPDMSFVSNASSSNLKTADIERFKHVAKSIRKLKFTDSVSLKFKPLNANELSLHVYSDASFQNLPDGSSQGGFIIILTDGIVLHPISWSSKPIRRISRSTLEAETLSQDTIDSASFISQVFSFILDSGITVQCYTDSKQLYQAIMSSKPVLEKPYG